MSKRFHFIAIVLGTTMAVVLVFWVVSNRLTAQDSAPPPPLPAGEGPEVLTRGPIHEAFAEMVNPNPESGQVVGKQPPQAIEEVPPTEKPAGDYIWIPGYWAWDQDRDQGRGDYIWISGVWRLPPPGTTWVPGYWNQAAQRLPMGQGLLGAGNRRGGPTDRRDGISAAAPAVARDWTERARPIGRILLGAGLLALAGGPEHLRLAAGALEPRLRRLGLDPGPLRLDARRIRLPRRPLGLCAGSAWRGVLPGLLRPGRITCGTGTTTTRPSASRPGCCTATCSAGRTTATILATTTIRRFVTVGIYPWLRRPLRLRAAVRA